MLFFSRALIQDQGGRREAREAWKVCSLVGNVHGDGDGDGDGDTKAQLSLITRW